MAAFIRRMGYRILASEASNIFNTVKYNPHMDLKRYVRALKRRPVKVLYPDDKLEKRIEKKQANVRVVDQQRPESHQTHVANKSSEKNKQKAGINEFVDSDVRRNPKQIMKAARDDISFDDGLNGLRYDKAFPGDKRLARAASVARSKKFREQQGKILLEGKRLISDALAAGGIPQILFFSTVELLRELPLDKLRRATLVKVKSEDIKMWSDLVAPQGVMAIFSRPDASRLVFPPEQRNQSLPFYLICDNLRDPGNVGTILRCAAAAGCQSVLLTKGCVDIWEPKVLRAAMGAHFRVPIIPSLDWEVIPNYLPATVTVHLADNLSGLEKDADDGSSGPPKKAGDYGWVSSRPNRKSVRYEEYGAEYESDSDEEEKECPKLSLPDVESQLYHKNWVQSHTALVIGGETHGLSLEALQLAERTDGRRLCVSMVTGMDSLNCAVAAGILLFEGKRQLTALAGQAGKKSRIKMP